MLASQVAEGLLPPVAERLPVQPLVMRPYDQIGLYGGALQRATPGDVSRENIVERTLGENLWGWSRPIPDRIEPNLALKHDYLDGGRTLRLHLRAGLRWSDGEPFTTADILFWYEDMMLNEEARNDPFFPPEWTAGGRPLGMRALNETILEIFSDEPLGRMEEILTNDIIAYPRHVLAPLHPRYNPEARYADFRRRTTRAELTYSPGIPRISAWAPVEWRKGQRIIYERNPYYWKVDTAGNQLPYADRLVFQVIPNAEIMLFKFINGELDLVSRIRKGDAYPTLKAYEQRGRFCVHYSPPSPFSSLVFNWDTPDPNLRRAFRNRKVRIALSLAINRKEISEVVMHGLLEPAGYALGPTNPLFSEEQFRRFADFDPAEARRLLEEEGYRDLNGDGYRQFPDGSRFTITIDWESDKAPPTPIAELLVEYWEAVGIRTHLNIALSNIIFQRRLNAEFEVLEKRQAQNLFEQAEHFAIMGPNLPYWHPRADRDGPEWLHEATALLQRAIASADPAVRHELGAKVRDLHSASIPMITLGAVRETWAAHIRLGNVPREAYLESLYRGWERPMMHEQIYIRE